MTAPSNSQEPAASFGTSSFADREFLAQGYSGALAVLSLIGGLVMLAMAALLFLMTLNLPDTPQHKFEPGLNWDFMSQVGLCVIGTLSILHALFLLRNTRRVHLSGSGIQINTFISRRFVDWRAITRIARGKRSSIYGQSVEALELLDTEGRRRAVIAGSLADFETLAQTLIDQTSAVTGQKTFDKEANEQQQITREKRKTRWAAWLLLLFAVGMAAALAAGIWEEVHTRRLARDGVIVEAAINRTWVVRVTRYIEFTFRDSAGRSFTREAMMLDGPEWQQAQHARTIPVTYLPDAPNWNRLVKGEDAGPEFGGSFIFVTGFGLIMFGTLAVIALLGYDLKSEDGVFRLTRHGRSLKEWGGSRKS